jgi:hypothetical protein
MTAEALMISWILELQQQANGALNAPCSDAAGFQFTPAM